MSVNESGIPMTRYRGLEATESEKRAAFARASEVVEWEKGGKTFILCIPLRVILRAGSLGGDVREIEGGWHYLRPEDMFKEWRDIKLVARDYRKGE